MTPLSATLPGIRSFRKRHGITFPTLVDPTEALVKRYGFGAYPATAVIDRGGSIRFHHVGFRSGNERILEQEIRAAIAGAAPGRG